MNPLKLIEALEIVQKPTTAAQDFRLALVCGFTPLHLEPLLGAHLRLRLPSRRIKIETGVFGDLTGNLARAAAGAADAMAVIAEWPDFDARLGFRSLGSWSPDNFAAILAEVEASCEQLKQAIGEAADRTPIIVCLPTVPLPPVASSSGLQESAIGSQIEWAIAGLARALVEGAGVTLINGQYLDRVSPLEQRYDVDSDLRFGFPYSCSHASRLAQAISRLTAADPPKKAIITDLDDTLWKGILGE